MKIFGVVRNMDMCLSNIRKELQELFFSEEKVEEILDFIEFLQKKEIDLESKVLSEDPEIMNSLEESEREYQEGEFVDFNEIRKDR
ncbi:MAG: hypothetical protein K8T10_19265 [Candidatus Eremiobacteraeota bacterium]|nr:hypothetical protein [Candidatus Eremiobacteraeota bacterium]